VSLCYDELHGRLLSGRIASCYTEANYNDTIGAA
jgi:hypothetical protein